MTYRRVALALLVTSFAVTRLATAWLADHPDSYAPFSITPDVDAIYAMWAEQLVDQGRHPYSEIRIEYPPAALPFIAAPEVGRADADDYRTRYIALMLALDGAAFAALLALAGRWGSLLGPWVWVLFVPLLGPIVYLRLDLIPALATVLTLERASVGSWWASGGWLGFGAMAKVFPAFLAPAGLVTSTRRRDFVVGFALFAALWLLPFADRLPVLFADVAGYHSARGIQIESTPGAVLLVAKAFGAGVQVVYEFAALHLAGDAVAYFERASLAASVAVVAAGTWLSARMPRGDSRSLAAVMLVTLALLLAVGTVLSPQFVVWLLALGAVVACDEGTRVKGPVLLLGPIAALTQWIYPFAYGAVVNAEVEGLVVLGARNLLILLAGAIAFVMLLRGQRRATASSAP